MDDLKELIGKKKNIPWKRGDMIGVGAYKTVYKGYNTSEGTECAWNEVQIFGLAQKEAMKIFQEIMLLKSINSPYIIDIKDSWSDKNKIIFITDLLSSGTLKGYIKNIGKVSLRSVKKWSTQILKAIRYLHERNIIHRDLKCENIFMNGIEGDVKLGDLGLSVIKDHAESKQKMSVVGTTPFIAPELYKQDYNEKVDIYAFGMSLLELVTGDYPYSECQNDYQIMKKVTSHPIVPPEGLKKVKDPLFLEFIKHCISEDPDTRWSAEKLLEHQFLVIDQVAHKEVYFTYETKEGDGDDDEQNEPVFQQVVFDFRSKGGEDDIPQPKEKSGEHESKEKIGESDSIVQHQGNKSSNSGSNKKIGNEENDNTRISSKEPEEETEGESTKIEQRTTPEKEIPKQVESNPLPIPIPTGRPEEERNGGRNSNSKEGNEKSENDSNGSSETGKPKPEDSVTNQSEKEDKEEVVLETKSLCKIMIEQKSNNDSNSVNVYLYLRNNESSPIPEKTEPKKENQNGIVETELKEIAFPFYSTDETVKGICKELYRSCSEYIAEISKKDVHLVCEAIKQALCSVKREDENQSDTEQDDASQRQEEEGEEDEIEKKKEQEVESNNPQIRPKAGNGEQEHEEVEEDEESGSNGGGRKKKKKIEKKDKKPKLEDLVEKMEELLFKEDDD